MSRDIQCFRIVLATIALSCLTRAGTAHEFWLTASDPAPAPGMPVDVGACSGTGFRGEPRPWAAARCVEFAMHTFRPFGLAALGREDDLAWVRQTFPDAGGTWVQYQSNFASIELPGDRFDAYLEDEGLSGPLAARRGASRAGVVRERYRRCAKLWFAGRDARRAVRPLGQPLELVPLAMPGAAPTLRLRVLWLGRPLAGALAKTWRQPWGPGGRARPIAERDSVGESESRRTDARGEVAFEVGSSGEWLVSVVHMVPSADRANADWESTWASLTFARPERASPRTGAGARREPRADADASRRE